MLARLKDIMRGRKGEWIVSFATRENVSELFDEMAEEDVSIEIKKHNKRRSLDANAYCWVLIGKIAESLNLPKNEVYRKEILEHGAFRVHCIEDKEVEGACEDWCSFGLGFQVEKFPSKIPGCTNVIFYKGSSYYDTKQMAKLIDGIIHEAESLGIPTITEDKAKELVNQWKI